MRLFVSAALDGLAGEVSQIQDLLADADGLDLTDPDQAHVTLKFLGDTDPDRLPELTSQLRTAVDETGVEPFEVEFGGLGVFPHLDYISVVWLGVRQGGGKLARLHERIEERTTAMGFEPEDHEFTPHVTLARMNHAGGKELVQNVVRNRDPDAGTMTLEAVRLTESTLTPDGPEYRTVDHVGLQR